MIYCIETKIQHTKCLFHESLYIRLPSNVHTRVHTQKRLVIFSVPSFTSSVRKMLSPPSK